MHAQVRQRQREQKRHHQDQGDRHASHQRLKTDRFAALSGAELARDLEQLCLGPLTADAGLEQRQRLWRGNQPQRSEKCCLVKTERRAQNSRHGVAPRSYLEGRAERAWIGMEARAPKRVGDYGAGQIFRRGQAAAPDRDAQHVEKVGRHARVGETARA